MRILGIDPGYERMGVAILEKDAQTKKETMVFSNCVRTSSKLVMPDRLLEIGTAVEGLIKKYQPDAVAIETLYFAKNTTTALAVAEARGVIQYVARTHTIPCFEYHPNTIKIAITGYGHATKENIASMIPKLISISADKKIDDELDAIAIALTHSAHIK